MYTLYCTNQDFVQAQDFYKLKVLYDSRYCMVHYIDQTQGTEQHLMLYRPRYRTIHGTAQYIILYKLRYCTNSRFCITQGTVHIMLYKPRYCTNSRYWYNSRYCTMHYIVQTKILYKPRYCTNPWYCTIKGAVQFRVLYNTSYCTN